MPPPGVTDLQVPAARPCGLDANTMLRRFRRGLADASSFMLVASDPLVIAAARDASRRLNGPRPVHIVSGAEALHRLVGPGQPPRQLVLEGGTAGGILLSAASDPFSSTDVIIVARPGDAVPAGLRAVPAEGESLAEALATPRPGQAAPTGDAAALADGLARGEITVRFQPVVRLADRRAVMVEALARWERPHAAYGPNSFVSIAERSGLALDLSFSVARQALAGMNGAAFRQGLRMSFNTPLTVMLRPDLPSRLTDMVAKAGQRPEMVMLELTESMAVRDTALLRRALDRLERAGFGVLLDDLVLDDPRSALLDLPFAGVKLDRSLLAELPTRRRARAQVERLAREAHRRGRVVIAEGVNTAAQWRLVAAAGCDMAQGYGVGRPIQPAALPAWGAAWRAAGLAPGQA